MPEKALVELSRYRLEKSHEMLAAAQRDADVEDYASANNRAYYCIFHAMRAVLALDGEDFKKHSAVISRFTLRYLKADILPRRYGALISNAALIRNRSDYEDFFICSIEDTLKLLEGAESFYDAIEDYLKSRFAETNNE